MEAIGMGNKVHVNAIGLVDDESAFHISDLELFLDILYTENVGDGVGMKPDVTVVQNVGL
jgi:hypothetical protein